MRMVCISTSNDVVVGLRLAGVQSFQIKKKEEIINKIQELSEDDNVGIINVTEDVYKLSKDVIDNIMNTKDIPLVVIIPNSNNI